MAKEVNKVNLSKYAKEHLHDTATFGLGLQDEAREILREFDSL